MNSQWSTNVSVIGSSILVETQFAEAVPPVAEQEYIPENETGTTSQPQQKYARGMAGNDVDEPTQLNAWRTIFRAHR